MSKKKSKSKETPEERELRQYRKMQRQMAETSMMAASFAGTPEGYPPIGISDVAKVVRPEKIGSLREYLEKYTDRDMRTIDSKIRRIKAVDKTQNILPKTANKPKGNQTKLYRFSELDSVWNKLKCAVPTLPNRKI